MLVKLLISALLAFLFIAIAKKRELVQLCALLFFVAQISIAAMAILTPANTTEWTYFTFDATGTTYFSLMAVVGLMAAWSSFSYLDTESVRHCKFFYISLIALNLALAGVYFSNNVAMGWIFLEATTLATAGLTYHRRTPRALEATWKYVFVSSVGIAVAYLGILLLSTVGASLSYVELAAAIGNGNTLYLKLAFVFILVGYSSKLELFPLFTVGVDANHATPSPAAAFVSSALVGGGFVSILRVYNVFQGNAEVFGWIQNVLLLTGVLSLVVAAVYMGRTGNFKRLLAYSTVENSGLIAIGLGIGGLGAYAAVLHSLAHTLLKSAAFLQLAVIGKMYKKYKIGQIGDYFRADPIGALALALITIALMAMPPSMLFRTELMMFAELAMSSKWWVLIPMAVALLAAIYWMAIKLLPILYKPCDLMRTIPNARNTPMSVVLIIIVLFTMVGGVWISPMLDSLVNAILMA